MKAINPAKQHPPPTEKSEALAEARSTDKPEATAEVKPAADAGADSGTEANKPGDSIPSGARFRTAGSTPTSHFIPINSSELKPAAYAVRGSGAHKDRILWLQWQPGDLIYPENDPQKRRSSLTQYNYTDLSDKTRIVTRCTISNLEYSKNRTNNSKYTRAIGAPIQSYVPGAWKGDVLDDFYNVNPAGSNAIRIGITTNSAHSLHGGTPRFNLECDAQIWSPSPNNPDVAHAIAQNFPIDGLVVADAEAPGYTPSKQEFIDVEPNDPNANISWHVLDRTNGRPVTNDLPEPKRSAYSTAMFGQLSGTNIRILPNGNDASSNNPGAVLFAKGVSSAKVTVQGDGQQAVALGIIVPADVGDAPQSYGEAISLFHPSWTNPLTNGYNNLNLHPTTDFGRPQFVLGDAVSADRNTRYSDLADSDEGDDSVICGGDVRCINSTGPKYSFYVVPSDTINVNVKCQGNGNVAGWIDWNLSGKFEEKEKSTSDVTCTNGTAKLSFKVPTDLARVVNIENFVPQSQSIMRIRTADPQEGPLKPVGPTVSGEVEDHGIEIISAGLRMVTRSIDPKGYVGNMNAVLAPTTWLPSANFVSALPEINNRVFAPGTNGLPEVTVYPETDPATGAVIGKRSEAIWNIAPGSFNISSAPVDASAPAAADLPYYEKTGFACGKSEGSIEIPDKPYAAEFVAENSELTSLQADHTTCSITYSPKPATLTWEKLDNADVHISGSEWTVTGPSVQAGARVKDCKGEPCADSAAGELKDLDPRPGYFKVSELKWGNYSLAEAKAPAGFILSDKTTQHNVKGEIKDFGRFQNEMHPPIAIPLTGGTASVFYVLTGLCLISGAVAGALLIARQGRSRGKVHY